MTQGSGVKRPILSICIPTHNRASHLENLFDCLRIIKEMQGNDVEICVSNNNSTDHTQQVIDTWQAILNLKAVTQSTNIGGTLNAIEVTKQADGKWIQLIGDDDEFNPENFNNLLNLLRISSEETWVLVGVENENGDEALIGNLTDGCYNSGSFRAKILITGLYRYGFIGMHIMPSTWLQTYQTLSYNSAQGWPHLALFIRYLASDGVVIVYKKAVIKQAAGPGALFWKASDWACVNLKKINIVGVLKEEKGVRKTFFNMVILRELYSGVNIKNLVLWKVLEVTDFNRNAILENCRCYRFLGFAAVLAVPNFLLLLLLWGTPVEAIRFILRQLGREKTISEYSLRKAEMAGLDGMDRGL